MIFVFSLDSEASFNAVYNYHAKMAQYRNAAEIPCILVGTQGELKITLFLYRNRKNVYARLVRAGSTFNGRHASLAFRASLIERAGAWTLFCAAAFSRVRSRRLIL